MFCMCIDRGYVGTGESKLCSVCVLTEGALVQGRARKLCSVCVLTEGALVQGRLSCDLYVY